LEINAFLKPPEKSLKSGIFFFVHEIWMDLGKQGEKQKLNNIWKVTNQKPF